MGHRTYNSTMLFVFFFSRTYPICLQNVNLNLHFKFLIVAPFQKLKISLGPRGHN